MDYDDLMTKLYMILLVFIMFGIPTLTIGVQATIMFWTELWWVTAALLVIPSLMIILWE